MNEAKFLRKQLATVDTPERINQGVATTLLRHYKKTFKKGDLVDRLSAISDYPEFEEQFKTEQPDLYSEWEEKISEYREQEQLILVLTMIRVRLKNTLLDPEAKAVCEQWTKEDITDPTKIHPTLSALLYLFASAELFGEEIEDWSVLNTPPEEKEESEVAENAE